MFELRSGDHLLFNTLSSTTSPPQIPSYSSSSSSSSSYSTWRTGIRTIGLRRLRVILIPILACLLLAAFPPFLSAQDETESEQLMFIPPPVQGVISLGVYDEKGKLVKVLKKAADISSFKSSLNGLYVDWDWTDAESKPVPGDRYLARGVLVGDIGVKGIGFFLNDWADQTKESRIQKINTAALLNNSRVAVLADQSRLLVVDPKLNESKAATVGWPVEGMKSSGTELLVFDHSQVAMIDPTNGNQTFQKAFADIRDADAFGDQIAVLGTPTITLQVKDAAREITAPAADISQIALSTSSFVVANRNGKVWRYQNDQFTPVDVGETGELLDMRAGANDAVWLLVRTGTTTLLKEIDLSGKEIREIDLPEEVRNANHLSVSRSEEDLLLISITDKTQRVTGLRFQTANSGKSVWEKWLDRSLVTFQSFDVKDGKVVPADQKTDSTPIVVKPEQNPLQRNGRESKFQLIVSADESGAWVSSIDGLPLVQVSKTQNIKEIHWLPDGPTGMRVYVSDGSVVEEYQVAHLNRLYRFDAGAFK
jgi:hypothetical protein